MKLIVSIKQDVLMDVDLKYYNNMTATQLFTESKAVVLRLNTYTLLTPDFSLKFQLIDISAGLFCGA